MITRTTRAVAAVALILLMVLTGCSSSPEQPDAPGVDDHTQAPGPQDSVIADVATSWLTAVYSWQPAADRSPTDALIRARRWATGPLADPNPPRVSTRPDPQWEAWRSSGDVITATIDDLDVISTGMTATTSARVSQVAMHADGDSSPIPRLKVTVSLKKLESGHWKVTDYRALPAN